MTWQEVGQIGSLIVAAAAARWGYLQSKKSDEVSEQSLIATETRAGLQSIITGLNTFIDQLQEGVVSHRETVLYLESRLAFVIAENLELRAELGRLRKKYGENGNEKGESS